jgi:hypothetical protein
MLPALGLDSLVFFFVLPIGVLAGVRWWRNQTGAARTPPGGPLRRSREADVLASASTDHVPTLTASEPGYIADSQGELMTCRRMTVSTTAPALRPKARSVLALRQ